MVSKPCFPPRRGNSWDSTGTRGIVCWQDEDHHQESLARSGVGYWSPEDSAIFKKWAPKICFYPAPRSLPRNGHYHSGKNDNDTDFFVHLVQDRMFSFSNTCSSGKWPTLKNKPPIFQGSIFYLHDWVWEEESRVLSRFHVVFGDVGIDSRLRMKGAEERIGSSIYMYIQSGVCLNPVTVPK